MTGTGRGARRGRVGLRVRLQSDPSQTGTLTVDPLRDDQPWATGVVEWDVVWDGPLRANAYHDDGAWWVRLDWEPTVALRLEVV